jgi:HNH endonuclease
MMSEDWRAAVHRELAAGRRRKGPPKPYDTRGWKQRRAELKDGAVCCLCARFGLAVPATVADHVVPVTNGGDFEGELQPLCFECHKIKRVIEGRWRKGTLAITELNLAVGRQAMHLRAAAFGVGIDGLLICRASDSR